MQIEELVFSMDERVTTESQCSITTQITGTIWGTENLCKHPKEEIAETLASVLKSIPRCTKITCEVGQPLKFTRIESITQKEFPSMDTHHIDQLEHTAGRFGIFSCKERKGIRLLSPYRQKIDKCSQ
jgi:hypothetical protein